MGTRGLIGFIIKGKRRGAYNQWDSYPEALGKNIIEFILSLDEGAIKEMQRLVEDLIWVHYSEIEELSDEEAQRIYHHVPIRLCGGEMERPFRIVHAPKHQEIIERLRNLDLLNRIQSGQERVIVDDSDFWNSGLCEWVYDIDFENRFVQVIGLAEETVTFPFAELKPGILEVYRDDPELQIRVKRAAKALFAETKAQTESSSQMDESVQGVEGDKTPTGPSDGSTPIGPSGDSGA